VKLFTNSNFKKMSNSYAHPVRKSECQQLAEELQIEIFDERPGPGDYYIAGRNTEADLFQCDYVKNGTVFPKGSGYPFNLHECYRVSGFEN